MKFLCRVRLKRDVERFEIFQFNKQNNNMIYRSNIDDDAAVELAQRLRTNSTDDHLSLPFFRLRETGVCAIASALKVNTTIKHLELSLPVAQDELAIVIADVVSVNSTLITLSLSNCWIRDRGAAAIGRVLKTNSSLTHLWLEFNQIGAIGTTEIARALVENTCLKELCLHENCLGDEGAISIAHALTANTALRFLDLMSTGISDIGQNALLKAVTATNSMSSYNSTLSYLSIGNTGFVHISSRPNEINGDMAHLIESAVCTNQKLRSSGAFRPTRMYVLVREYVHFSAYKPTNSFWRHICRRQGDQTNVVLSAEG
jgi:Leucine Rich repeat